MIDFIIVNGEHRPPGRLGPVIGLGFSIGDSWHQVKTGRFRVGVRSRDPHKDQFPLW